MLIKGLQKQTLLDYPGKIACTIFLFGCNFKCPYCHNPELVDANLSRDIKTYSEEEIIDFLSQNKQFLEGVCITGGEPTLNIDLPNFIKKIKSLGYPVKLDTNGTNPAMLNSLLKENLIDYVAIDIKTSLEKYEKAVNARINIEDIKRSIQLASQFQNYEFRITVLPKLATKDDLLGIAKFLKENKANSKFVMQQFQPSKCLDKSFEKEKPYSEEQLKEFQQMLKPYFKKVEVRI
jgi:pyruvate formate lyase activating enzyme